MEGFVVSWEHTNRSTIRQAEGKTRVEVEKERKVKHEIQSANKADLGRGLGKNRKQIRE
uniref:Uncharacterized protein n=1 Tax=Anguilla anguilla TaxID=7936 RepID=A0A0E9PJF1_ANGAN